MLLYKYIVLKAEKDSEYMDNVGRFIGKYGMKVRRDNPKQIYAALVKIVNDGGVPALHELAGLHPDRELILEAAKSGKMFDACGCFGSEGTTEVVNTDAVKATDEAKKDESKDSGNKTFGIPEKTFNVMIISGAIIFGTILLAQVFKK